MWGNKLKNLGLPIAACLGVVSFAAADTEPDPPYFIGLGAGISRLQPNTHSTGYHIENGTGVGGKLYLGYAATRELSLQLYYADLGKVKLSPNGEIHYRDTGINATYYIFQPKTTLTDLKVFVRFGFGKMQNRTNLNYERDNPRHLMHGAGVEYRLDNDYALRADLDMYDKDAHLYTLSALWRFGGNPPPSFPEPLIVPLEPVTPEVPEIAAQPEPEPIPEPEPMDPVSADSDADGITDPEDSCPDTAPGLKVDATGCPLADEIILKGVVFARDSAELLGESNAILDEVTLILQRYPDLRVEVVGHTDSHGGAQHNQRLSEQRATSVRTYLIDSGISSDRLGVRGMGENEPVADNDTVEGRAQNRRVVLHILK